LRQYDLAASPNRWLVLAAHDQQTLGQIAYRNLPVDHKVYLTDPRDHLLAAEDASASRLIRTLDNLPDGLEQPRYNSAAGQFYESGRDANMVQQFDPTMLVKQTPIGDDCRLAGLAINASQGLALLGCQTQHTDFWDLRSGRMVATVDHAGSW
jgi:hypothetical protein